MTITASAQFLKDITGEWVSSFSKENGEPEWLTRLRVGAYEEFARLPWPDKKDEKWKRTNLKSLKWDSLTFPTALKKETAPRKESGGFLDTMETNGHKPARQTWHWNHGLIEDSTANLKAEGVGWMSLRQAVDSQGEMIEKKWSEAIEKAKGNKFLLLNLALATEGTVIRVAKNKDVATPLVQFVISGTGHFARFSVNFIHIEDNSRVQVWEDLSGYGHGDPEFPTFISTYTGVSVGANAQASFYHLQHWNNETVHFQFRDLVQGASSRLNTVSLEAGGRIFHNDSTLHLSGAGAENKVLGVLFGDETQNFETWITQNHLSPQTTSDIQYRAALKGKARSFFSGMVSIPKGAQLSDAYQSCKTLLLSRDARAEAIPNLEILADDVKCSHGAAVGPVDEDQKFYLQSRGIPPEMAEKIIIQGFFEPVIAAVPFETVQERLRIFIEEKLGR